MSFGEVRALSATSSAPLPNELHLAVEHIDITCLRFEKDVGMALSNIEMCYITLEIMILWYWLRERSKNGWKVIEKIERYLFIYTYTNTYICTHV